MDARQRARLAVAHTALGLLRRRDFRKTVGGVDNEGAHMVIPALHDDPMGYFFDQLRAAGGPIYAALLVDDGVAVVGMEAKKPPKHAAPDHDEGCPIHRDIEIIMVLDYLRACRAAVTCYEVAPSVLVELVDDTRVGTTQLVVSQRAKVS